MNLDKRSMALVATLTGMAACAGQQTNPATAAETGDERSSDLCPSGEPRVYKVLDQNNPAETHYEVCDKRYLITYTRSELGAQSTRHEVPAEAKKGNEKQEPND